MQSGKADKLTEFIFFFFFVVISVGFVEQRYTFVENQPFGIIQVRKSAASDVPFQVRVIGGELTLASLTISSNYNYVICLRI